MHGHSSDRSLKTISLSVEGPANQERRRFRSIHRSLPRASSTFFWLVTTLTLSKAHFHAPSDFVALIEEMTMLRDLRCAQVTWGALPALLRTPRALRARAQRQKDATSHLPPWHIYVTTTYCSSNWLQASLWALRSLIALKNDTIPDNQFLGLLAMARLIERFFPSLPDSDVERVVVWDPRQWTYGARRSVNLGEHILKHKT